MPLQTAVFLTIKNTNMAAIKTSEMDTKQNEGEILHGNILNVQILL
jgi:hypothetical protein